MDTWPNGATPCACEQTEIRVSNAVVCSFRHLHTGATSLNGSAVVGAGVGASVGLCEGLWLKLGEGVGAKGSKPADVCTVKPCQAVGMSELEVLEPAVP